MSCQDGAISWATVSSSTQYLDVPSFIFSIQHKYIMAQEGFYNPKSGTVVFPLNLCSQVRQQFLQPCILVFPTLNYQFLDQTQNFCVFFQLLSYLVCLLGIETNSQSGINCQAFNIDCPVNQGYVIHSLSARQCGAGQCQKTTDKMENQLTNYFITVLVKPSILVMTLVLISYYFAVFPLFSVSFPSCHHLFLTRICITLTSSNRSKYVTMITVLSMMMA